MKKIKFLSAIGTSLLLINFTVLPFYSNAQTDSIGKTTIQNFAYDRFGRSFSSEDLEMTSYGGSGY